MGQFLVHYGVAARDTARTQCITNPRIIRITTMAPFRDIPPIKDVVLELGIIRMRMHVKDPGGEGYRPRLCLCVEQRSGMVLHFEMSEPLETYLPLAVDCIADAGDRIGGLPRQVQVRDPKLAKDLRPPLEALGIEVVVREALPALDDALAGMNQFERLGGGQREHALVHDKSITLDRFISFAEAGKLFYEARPWRHLLDEDMIEIASPPGPKGTRMAQVLGAGGQTFGLGFVASREAHEQIHATGEPPRGGIWNLLYYEFDELPYDDGETYERHNLPVAAPDAYPMFCKMSRSRGHAFPSAAELAWGEGLLRAIAATTEPELDSGRWDKRVETSAGPMTFELSLPLLLEETSGVAPAGAHALFTRMTFQTEKMLLDADEPTAATRAQDLCFEAYQSRGRRQMQLARQALEIDPGCCEAMLILANRKEGDPREALPLLEQAVEAGAARLGKEMFDDNAGHFWGILETRPYMRARHALATTLMNLGQFDRAADHLRDMLRLNPGDNQGNRYPLAHALLYADRLDELEDLLNHPDYADDMSPEWSFTRALLAFRRHGDGPESRRRLEAAQKHNPYVSLLLSGRAPMPSGLPEDYSPGSVEEAILCVQGIGDAWQQTPGAVEWLAAMQPKPAKTRATGTKARGGKRKPRKKGK